MRPWLALLALAAVAVGVAVAAPGDDTPTTAAVVVAAPGDDTPTTAAVVRVVDGDTVALAGGARVRLLQIDAPEVSGGECHARAARSQLVRLLPAGTRVRLELDPRLDRVDRYGRTLAYVWKGRELVNRTVVLRGAASVWFYGGVRGKHAERLLDAARRARAARRGLWGACPGTRLDPSRGVETRGTAPRPAGRACDASYPGVCIPPPPPDLDCADVPHRDFRVLPPDPHRFDGSDDDGRGCER